jgi:iron complex outermembrane receptor protein
MLNVPLSDIVSSRFAFNYDSNHGYVRDYPAGRDLQARDIWMGRGKLKINASDRLTVKISGDYSVKDDTEGVAFANILGAPQQTGLAVGGQGSTNFYNTADNFGEQTDGGYGRFPNWRPYIRVRQAGVQVRADLDLNFATFASISGWRDSQLDESTDTDATSAPLQHDFFFESSNSYSQEFQLASKSDGPFTWIGGLYYFHEEGRTEFDIFGSAIDQSFGLTPGPESGGYGGGVGLNAVGHVSVQAYAPFAQLSYKINDKLAVTIGGRYSSETKELLDNHVFASGLGPQIPVYDQEGLKVKFTDVSPRAVFNFTPTDDVLLYLSYSKGFKSGGINTPAFGPASTVRPEILKSYELGWKTQYGPVRFNGAAFYYNYKDLQVQRIDAATASNVVQNAASARIWGVETDLLYAVTRSFELGFGSSYLNAKFTDFQGDAFVSAAGTPACAAAGGVATLAAACLGLVPQRTSFEGAQLPLAPKFSGYLRAKYDIGLGDRLGDLSLNALLSYTDAFVYTVDRLTPEPSKFLLSAGLTWRPIDGKLLISVFGENLLNKEYNVFQTELGNGAFHIAAPPRAWGVKVGYSF